MAIELGIAKQEIALSKNPEFEDVGQVKPCIVCGKPDWCRRTSNGSVSICYRPVGGLPISSDRNGTPIAVVRADGSAVRRPRHNCGISAKRKPVLNSDQLHEVYSALLDRLSLTKRHQAGLFARGLSVEWIERAGYRSMPCNYSERSEIAETLLSRFGLPATKVPGIVSKDGRNFLAGGSGIAIPVRDHVSRICGLRIRADEAERSKYTWLSSKKYGGEGCPSLIHVPIHDPTYHHTVRITEGELKADVATHLTGMLTLSVPGVSNWRPVIPILKALAPKRVHIAYDADWRTNANVERSLGQLALAVASQFETGIETWS